MSKSVKSVSLFLIFSLLMLNSFALDDELTGEKFNNAKEIREYNYIPYEDTINTGNLKLKEPKLKYNPENFEDLYERIIVVSPVRHLSFERIKENDEIELMIVKDSDKWNLKKGDKIKAKVEAISPNNYFGIPQEVILDNYTINDTTTAKGEIQLSGANRALWIHPLSLTLNALCCVGFLLYFVKGGKVKLSPNQQFEIFLKEE